LLAPHWDCAVHVERIVLGQRVQRTAVPREPRRVLNNL
jgi:hypothetical protein